MALSPLDAKATRIEYYATVGEPLCEFNYVPYGLGYCDIAVGSSKEVPYGELIKVISHFSFLLMIKKFQPLAYMTACFYPTSLAMLESPSYESLYDVLQVANECSAIDYRFNRLIFPPPRPKDFMNCFWLILPFKYSFTKLQGLLIG